MEVKRRFFITLPDGKTERPSTWTRRASVGGGFFKRKEDAAGFAELRERRGKNASGRTGANRAICDDLPGGKRVFDLLVEALETSDFEALRRGFLRENLRRVGLRQPGDGRRDARKGLKNGRND